MAALRNALLRLGFLAALLVMMQARAATFQVVIDTNSLGLNGQNWDLAFDFIDGDGDPQSNTATILNFAITDGSLTGAPYPFVLGDVNGDLYTAPPVVLRDTAQSEYFDNANLGSLITFVLEITGNSLGGLTPDAFSFLILDPGTGLPPFQTQDPTGANALVVYGIGNDPQPELLFCPVDIDCGSVTPVVLAAPEPGALVLLMAGLLGLGVVHGRRKPSIA